MLDRSSATIIINSFTVERSIYLWSEKASWHNKGYMYIYLGGGIGPFSIDRAEIFQGE